MPSTSKCETETDLVDKAGEIEVFVAQVNQFEAIWRKLNNHSLGLIST